MISSPLNWLQSTITALPQTIPVSFVFTNSSDLLVQDSKSSPPTTLILGSDYTVSGGNGSVGSIIVVGSGTNVVAVNDVITISRAVPETQLTSFTTGGVLNPAMIENALDKLTEQTQQNANTITRCLRFQNDETLDGVMPLTARKGNVLGFDSSGNVAYYPFVSGSVVPQAVTGTANQVLVNGTSGTPATGAITLTTPQNIGTTSTVQFGKIGVNGSAVNNSDLTVLRSVPSTTAQASVLVYGGLTAGYDLHPNAFRDSSVFTPTIAADAYASYDAQSTMGGTVGLNHYRGFQARHAYTGTGTLGEMSGYMTANMGLSGAGNITFMRGFYVSQPNISGGGTVGQFDGIYMDQLSNSTGLVNAIYIAGNNRVFMGGGQLITSALLAPPAGATSARGSFTFDQTSQTGLAVMNSNATATGRFIDFCNNGGTVQGSVTQTNSTTVAYNTSSDSRLKENVRDMVDSGSIIDAMRPVVFDWKWGGKDFHGFIAQELDAVFPEAVSKGDSEEEIVTAWGVDFSKIVPLLTSEIKALRLRVAALEAK